MDVDPAGYIIDYKDLFKSLEGAVTDYTSGALDGYDKDDVSGLLKDRLVKGRERLIHDGWFHLYFASFNHSDDRK